MKLSPKLKNTRAAKIPLWCQKCGNFWLSVNFPLTSMSIVPPTLSLSPPLLSFTIYNRGVSSAAEERLSSVRLTHLPLNNLITLQNNACLSRRLMLYRPKFPKPNMQYSGRKYVQGCVITYGQIHTA